MPNISIIIPVRFSKFVFEAKERLERLLGSIPSKFFEVTVVDYGSSPAEAERIRELCRLHRHVRLVRADTELEPFSAGAARNLGAQHARTPVIMFNDLDFLGSPDMYRRIAELAEARNIQENAYDFFTVPVAFLTPEGTRTYLDEAHNGMGERRFFSNILQNKSSVVSTIAFAGSQVICNRMHYLAIGGSDSRFFGHGAEDYDVQHRLAAYCPIATRPQDYYKDVKSNQINEYRGFRAYFSLYGIEVLYHGIFLVHLWHPRRDEPGYMQSNRNFSLLEKTMREFDVHRRPPTPLPDLSNKDKTLVLIPPRSMAQENLRHALPITGSFTIADERDFADAGALLQVVSDGGYNRVGFLNPYGNAHRLSLYEAVRRSGIKYWTFDRGALPKSWFFDSRGFNADSGSYLPEHWDSILSAEQEEKIKAYIRTLRGSEETLEQNGSRRGVQHVREILRAGTRQILFIPLQRPGDTVTRYFTGEVGEYEQFYRWISEIASQLDKNRWLIVAKKHPLENHRPALGDAVTFAPDDMHVHDLISAADKVLTFNSGVGLLALSFYRAVICCGDSFYTHEGLAKRANSPMDAVRLVTDQWSVDIDRVHRFLNYLINDFYSFGEATYKQQGTQNLATGIRYTSIRGLARNPVILGNAREHYWLRSFVFNSFGNEKARVPSPASKVQTTENSRSTPHIPRGSEQNEAIRRRILFRAFSKLAVPLLDAKMKRKITEKPVDFFRDAKSPLTKFVAKHLLHEEAAR